MIVETISTQKMPDYGYELRTELWKVTEEDESSLIVAAYSSLDGKYIGNVKDAYYLCRIKGIRPMIHKVENKVCSIGFCKKENKWYGWSHRAIFGFTVGDEVKEGDCTASSGWTDECLVKHPEWNLCLPIGFKAETMDDAKRMAIAFADSVG